MGPAHVARAVLVTDGFAVIPAALDDDVVATVRRVVEVVVDEDRTGGCERDGNFLVPLRWNDELVGQLLAAPGFVDRVRRRDGGP